MADHDEMERLIIVIRSLAVAEDIVRHVLSELPIPVLIADLFTETGPDHKAIIALDRARTLIADEPISENAKLAHSDLVLEWLTAYEMVSMWKLAGPAPWRLAIAETALARLAALGEMIEEEDFGDDE